MSKYYDTSTTTRFDNNSTNSLLYPLPPYLKPSNRYAELKQNLRREQQVSSRSNASSFYSGSQMRKEPLPTLNMGKRKKEILRQSDENLRLMERILDSKPHISRRKLESDYSRSRGHMVLASQYPHYKLTSDSSRDLAKLEAGFTINSDQKKVFSNPKDLANFSYREQYLQKSRKHKYDGSGRQRDLNISFLNGEDFLPRHPGISFQRMPTQVTSVAREVGSPINMQDILEYLEQNESEGEFEVYYYGNTAYDNSSTPLGQHQRQKKVSIVKSKSLSSADRRHQQQQEYLSESRPLSRISYEEEEIYTSHHNNRLRPMPMKKQIRLPDTNELLIETTPPPGVMRHGVTNHNNEYEIIYMNKSRNGRTASRGAREDRDRIHMMYDDRNRDDNIHVVYSENNFDGGNNKNNMVESQGSFDEDEQTVPKQQQQSSNYNNNNDPRNRFNDSYNAGARINNNSAIRGNRYRVNAQNSARRRSGSGIGKTNTLSNRSRSLGSSGGGGGGGGGGAKINAPISSNTAITRNRSNSIGLNRSSSFTGSRMNQHKVGNDRTPASANNNNNKNNNSNSFDNKPIKKPEAFIVY